MGRSAIVGLMMAFTCGCFLPRPTFVPLLILPDMYMSQSEGVVYQTALAMTTCDLNDHPVIWVRQYVFDDTMERRYVVIHEMKHVEQVKRSGLGCDGYMMKYRGSGDVRWDSEAEAWCAAYLAKKRDHLANEKDWQTVLAVMNSYDTSLSREQVPQYLPCQP